MEKKVMDDKWEKENSPDAIRETPFDTEDWERSLTVTLTLKPAIFSPFRELTLDAAFQNFRDFKNLVDYHLMNETSQPDGITLDVDPVVVCSLDEPLHYRAFMVFPADVDESRFCDVIHEAWGETTWGDQLSIEVV